MPRSPQWTDMHLIWHSRRGRRRNHLWQIFWWSVEGCRFCGGSKIALFHWQSQWPLTQGWRYRAACDELTDTSENLHVRWGEPWRNRLAVLIYNSSSYRTRIELRHPRFYQRICVQNWRTSCLSYWQTGFLKLRCLFLLTGPSVIISFTYLFYCTVVPCVYIRHDVVFDPLVSVNGNYGVPCKFILHTSFA